MITGQAPDNQMSCRPLITLTPASLLYEVAAAVCRACKPARFYVPKPLDNPQLSQLSGRVVVVARQQGVGIFISQKRKLEFRVAYPKTID